jgi:hypothetical protein
MMLATSLPSCAECHEIWEPKPPGTLWATSGLLWDSFMFTFTCEPYISLEKHIPCSHKNFLIVYHVTWNA